MQVPDELISDFISEAYESLDKVDSGIVLLEKNTSDEKNIANIFRAVHTIKGSSGFFALKRIEKLTHSAESILGLIRDRELGINQNSINVLLKFTDRLRWLIEGLEQNGQEASGDDAPLIVQLGALKNPLNAAEEDMVLSVLNEAENESALEEEASADVEAIASAKHLPIESAPLEVEPVHATEEGAAWELKAYDSLAPIKVSVELLDTLINNVSELVLARNRLIPFAEKFVDKNFLNTVSTIDKLTIELQDKIIRTRMQTVGQLWSKLPRLVRDVALHCEKEVQIFFTGEDTELDRTLLDAIKDPLTHIIRNCIDHGIEPVSERLARGKPRVGTLHLKASHDNGMVVIEVDDDGQGIDYEIVKAKAIQKKFITEFEAHALSEEELTQFIFMPGFSTRENVTEISGRGVGMDVVKTNITSIGGTIKISSRRHQGVQCVIRIPLTLAIIPALLVRAGGEYYAIPQLNLMELVRLKSSAANELENFYGTPVFRLRDMLLPLFHLSDLVDLEPKGARPLDDPLTMGALNIAVIQSLGTQFGLVVDEVLRLQEVVIKPLPTLLRPGSLFSGATILGDGQISLILDIDQVALKTRVFSRVKPLIPTQEAAPLLNKSEAPKQKMLLVSISGYGLSAIPIEYVNRMDKVAASKIIRSAHRDVLQYDQQVLRVLDLSQMLNHSSTSSQIEIYEEQLNLVIYFSPQGPLGFVVQDIDQIVELPKELHRTSPFQYGLLGMSLLGDRLVNVLNMPELLQLEVLQPQTLPLFESLT